MLRRYTEDDFDDLYRLQSHPEVTRFLLYDILSPEEVRASLAKRIVLPLLDSDGQGCTLAVTHGETGAHLGEVLLMLVSREQRTGEIGYVFHPEFHGHGYAFEAARELLRIGFGSLGLHRIVARLDARNAASASLLKRLGLRQEAHFRRNEFLKGEWTDELVFAMLADEWLG